MTFEEQAMTHDDRHAQLTAREEQLLEVLVDHVTDHGFQPSMRELARAVGLRSASTVHHYVTSLEAKGYVRRPQGRPRAIEILRGHDW